MRINKNIDTEKHNKLFNSYNNFSFSAIRGIQAGREYYIVMCPLKLINKIFLFNEAGIPAELRAQRTLNKARVPEMAAYLSENSNDYTFSSITASIDGDIEFIPLEEEGHLSKVGTLIVAMDAKFLINDGQHRRAAIEEALKKRPELGLETISVVFYRDRGLKKSQQMFSDLNKHAVKPTTSLNILYNHRDEFSRTLISILNKIPIFGNNLTEVEKTSISNRANKVFTLNSIYNATKELLGKREKNPTISDEEKIIVIEFWNEVYLNIKEWQEVLNKKSSPYELREKYVHVYGIVLHALGIIGNILLKKYPKTWKTKLEKLKGINWKRDNKEWEGKMLIGGKISKTRSCILQTTNFIKEKISLN